MALWNQRRTIGAAVLLVAVVVALGAWTQPQLCTSMLGTADEIARTPREDRRIEQMAIAISKSLTADQQTYGRLRSDISTIRNLVPSLQEVLYQPIDDGRSLILKLNPLARVLQKVGLYHQWDCLNEHYRLESIDAIPRHGSVVLHFKGTYDMRRIAGLYGALSGVERAETNKLAVIDSRRTLCASTRGSTWHYVFFENIGSGRLHHFSSDPERGVSALDAWDVPESAQEMDATEPPWVAQFWNAEACGEER